MHCIEEDFLICAKVRKIIEFGLPLLLLNLIQSFFCNSFFLQPNDYYSFIHWLPTEGVCKSENL